MNKLNYLKLVSLLAFILFAMPSCSDDDDKGVDITKENIVGKWQYILDEGYYTENGKRVTYRDNYENEEWFITFKADGTFSDMEEDYPSEGTWTLAGNKLTLKYQNGYSGIIYNVADLREKTLIIEEIDEEDDEYYYKYTLRRK